MTSQLQKRISLAGALNTAISLLTATKQPVTLDAALKLAEEIVAKLDKLAPVTEASGSFKRPQLTKARKGNSEPFFKNGVAQYGKHTGKTFEQIKTEAPDFIEYLRRDGRADEIAALEAAAGSENLPY